MNTIIEIQTAAPRQKLQQPENTLRHVHTSVETKGNLSFIEVLGLQLPQVAQEKLLRKSLLPMFGRLLVLTVFGNGYQDDWLHHLAKLQDEADQPTESRSSFLYFLETGETFDFFPTSETSPERHYISKIIETLASSLSTSGCSPHSPKKLCPVCLDVP